MLTLVATPIGNLEDISQRALKVLKEVDAVLAEDTRRTKILLDHYQIKTPLFSYHKFNEKSSLAGLISQFEQGKRFALVSDAGTPCINDPGQVLVRACLEKKIPVTTVPGPSSILSALILSGFSSEKFQFIGFLPKKPLKTLQEISFYSGTTLAFESPERVLKTLELLFDLDPEWEIAVIREITKKFEEVQRASVRELLKYYSKAPLKGEIVLVFSQTEPHLENIELNDLIENLQTNLSLSLKDAVKLAAKLKKEPKSKIYNLVRRKENDRET